MLSSQAGCHGFDPRLPLQQLATLVSSLIHKRRTAPNYRIYAMRLVSFQPAGGTSLGGVVVGDQIFLLDSSVYPDMISFLTAGSAALANAEKLARGETEEHTSELQSLRHLVCRLL